NQEMGPRDWLQAASATSPILNSEEASKSDHPTRTNDLSAPGAASGIEVAGELAPAAGFPQHGRLGATPLEHERTAGVKMAAGRRRYRRGHVAFEHDALLPGAGIGNGGCGQQRARIGMQRS